MPTVGDILKASIVIWITFVLLMTLITHRKNFGFVREVLSRFTLGMFFKMPGLLVCILGSAVVLFALVPFLRFGWTTLLYGEPRNIVVIPLETASSSQIIWVKLLPLLFLGLLGVLMPFVVYTEEKIFRKGRDTWPRIIRSALVFGPIHFLVGVPICAALVLIFLGLFLGYRYRKKFRELVSKEGRKGAEKEALLHVTACHTLYNYLVFLIVAFGFTIRLFL